MERYIQEKLLDSEGFGKTYLVTDEKTKNELAMKVIDISRLSLRECELEPQKELSFSHQHVARYTKGFLSADKRQCVLFTEYCASKSFVTVDGNLYDLVRACINKDQTIPEDDLYTILVEVLLGLQYLHKNGIVHKDLKPQNVLMDNKGKVRVSDYACSRIFSTCRDYPYPITGTYNYMSPELLTGKKYGPNTDIWSLGCIMHELSCFDVVSY